MNPLPRMPAADCETKANGKLSKQTAAWNVAEGMGEKALSYRVSGYEQIFVVNDPEYTVTGKEGLAMTTSEAGKAMPKQDQRRHCHRKCGGDRRICEHLGFLFQREKTDF